jgi:hypothetical protein
MMLAVVDYGSIGTAIAMAYIAFMTYLNSRRSSKRDEKMDAIQEVSDKTADKVETVRKMTDGNLGEQLRIGMVAAKALYAVEPTSGNKELSDIAQRKFESHMEQIQKLEEQQTKDKALFDAGVQHGQENKLSV